MRTLAAAAIFCASLPAFSMASEDDFLRSIEGQWTGGGEVLRKLGGEKVKVTCDMKSDANASSLSMDGSCRALVVISRSFKANVTASGASYSGNYTGISGKPSKLIGARAGDTIDLDVTWANEIYGDRKARMTIQKVGANGLRIRTIDQDPSSGKTIVTTDLDLRRG
ncbi:hypothetical protein [Rhizobium terrae]|uniref:hypothetical protein n=1 Tax=Rhizobium terrae TaxID=2171756 RepID=UPI000E3D1346|nr:hypothetical protein [Rhizobium terrae]